MSKGNPDISVNIHNAILLILRGEQSVTQAVADIMRIPLEQVVDGCVYQFELEVWCNSCGGNKSGLMSCCHSGKIAKRISHYDLTVDEIYSGYFVLKTQPYREPLTLANDKGTLRAIKIREAV